MIDFDPTAPSHDRYRNTSHSEIDRFVAWLTENGARLDASETQGSVATRLVVNDSERNGRWIIPLIDVMPLFDEADERMAAEQPADVGIVCNSNVGTMLDVIYSGPEYVEVRRRSLIDPYVELQFLPSEE
jgi:hypothetical protein